MFSFFVVVAILSFIGFGSGILFRLVVFFSLHWHGNFIVWWLVVFDCINSACINSVAWLSPIGFQITRYHAHYIFNYESFVVLIHNVSCIARIGLWIICLFRNVFFPFDCNSNAMKREKNGFSMFFPLFRQVMWSNAFLKRTKQNGKWNVHGFIDIFMTDLMKRS